jgi:hypothetical protein
MAAHGTLRVVSGEYAAFKFNTMVSHLMELSNTLLRYRGTEVADGEAWHEAIDLLLLMLAPAAPHMTEELWSRRGAAAGRPWASIHAKAWPAVDTSAIADEPREVPIQVNGKVRDRVVVPAGTSGPELEALALSRPKIVAALGGRAPDRIIHAGGRLVNIVVRGEAPARRLGSRPVGRRWPEDDGQAPAAPVLATVASVPATVASRVRARWRAAFARLPQVVMSHQRRRPVRDES